MNNVEERGAKVLFRNLPTGTEGNHEKRES
jgi:hypothetical protein